MIELHGVKPVSPNLDGSVTLVTTVTCKFQGGQLYAIELHDPVAVAELGAFMQRQKKAVEGTTV